MIHIEKSSDNDEDPNVSFMWCGAFCTYGADASLRPADFDFVFPGGWEKATCKPCLLVVHGPALVMRSLMAQA